MPAQPVWHLRVPQILEKLQAADAPPFLDRPLVETLFGVKRRQAIRILGQCGGHQVGRAYLVPRRDLLLFLQDVELSGAVERLRQRKHRVQMAVGEMTDYAAEAQNLLLARRVQVRTNPGVLRRRPADLPGAIERVAPGVVQIRYYGALDLLSQVTELAAAAANDFLAFQKFFEEEG